MSLAHELQMGEDKVTQIWERGVQIADSTPDAFRNEWESHLNHARYNPNQIKTSDIVPCVMEKRASCSPMFGGGRRMDTCRVSTL